MARSFPALIAIFRVVRSGEVTLGATLSGAAKKLRYIEATRNPGLPLRGVSFTLQRLEVPKAGWIQLRNQAISNYGKSSYHCGEAERGE
jgi:hypothetical protein